MPFVDHWIQGCPWGPDDDQDDQDPRGGHVMVISEGEDSMDIREGDEPSQGYDHETGGDSISGYETKVPCQVLGEADENSTSGCGAEVPSQDLGEAEDNSTSGGKLSQGSRRDSISGQEAKLSQGSGKGIVGGFVTPSLFTPEVTPSLLIP